MVSFQGDQAPIVPFRANVAVPSRRKCVPDVDNTQHRPLLHLYNSDGVVEFY